MNRIKIFLSSVQNEFAVERRRIADYIRQDALFSMYFEPFLFEELPAQAVTEAIVNAVVHRNYTSNGSVQVMLFKDRLEVWNPGKLPQGMTIAKLAKEHTSNPVNPVLANPVYLSGYIEQMGTGTTDIIDHCLEYGLRKPEFHQDEDFRVILWRPEVQEGGKERVQERGTEGGEVRGEVKGEVGGEVDCKIKKVVPVPICSI